MDQVEEKKVKLGSYIFYAAVLAACLNGVAVGNLAGWPQAAIPQLLLSPNAAAAAAASLSEAQVSWIAGIFFVGMLTGGFASLAIAGYYGKRRLFLLASLPLVLGWSLVAVASSFWHYIFGRIILGVGGGMICHQTEMYLSEISPSHLRSSMSVVFCAFIHIGVLLSFAIGPHLSISSATGFYLAVVLTLASLYCIVAPETPFWLVKSGKIDEALATLRKLRGKLDVHEEFVGIVEFVEKSGVASMDAGICIGFKRVLRNTANRRAILLVVLLTTAQQFSGMAAMHSYAQLIFERTATIIPGRYVSLLIGLIELCCTIFSGFLVERVGRRVLVAASSIVCSACMAILGFHFHNHHELAVDTSVAAATAEDSGTLAIICIVVFALAYGLGLATMAAVVAAECLSMDARNLGAAAQNTTVCLSIFLITKLWQTIASSYGQQYSFWTAAVITALHTIVLLIKLPETRGKSLTEIQRLLAGSTDKSAPLLTGAKLQLVKVVPANKRPRGRKMADNNEYDRSTDA